MPTVFVAIELVERFRAPAFPFNDDDLQRAVMTAIRGKVGRFIGVAGDAPLLASPVGPLKPAMKIAYEIVGIQTGMPTKQETNGKAVA